MTQSILSRAHSVPAAERKTLRRLSQVFAILNLHIVKEALRPAQSSIDEQIQTIQELSAVVSKYPYYKYNHMWTRHTQETVRLLRLLLQTLLSYADSCPDFWRLAWSL